MESNNSLNEASNVRVNYTEELEQDRTDYDQYSEELQEQDVDEDQFWRDVEDLDEDHDNELNITIIPSPLVSEVKIGDLNYIFILIIIGNNLVYFLSDNSVVLKFHYFIDGFCVTIFPTAIVQYRLSTELPPASQTQVTFRNISKQSKISQTGAMRLNTWIQEI